MSSGTLANLTGKTLEGFVRQSLLSSGYSEIVAGKNDAFLTRENLTGRHFATQAVVGSTIYDQEREVDVLVINNLLFPKALVIECKWQQSPGSVDEKFPFFALSIKQSKVPTVVILDGGGYKASAMEWLKTQAGPRRALRAVWTMMEFQKAVNNGLFVKPPLVVSAKKRKTSVR